MKKKALTLDFILLLALMLSQVVHASDTLKVEVSNNSEGTVPAPVTIDGTDMFPIGEILNILDISGTETTLHDQTLLHSFVTFRGNCYDIIEGKTGVTEYVVDESGACFETTGNVYQLDKAAVYPTDSGGVYVPLNFISDHVVGSENDTIYIKEDNTLVFNMYSWDEKETGQVLEQNDISTVATVNPATLAMKINSPWLLTEDNGVLFDDNDHRVTPIIRNGNTLLPISSIMKQLGGKTVWSAADKKITLTLNQNTIEMWLNNKMAVVNGQKKEMNIAPTAINSRTMLPLRFVTENLGAAVLWDKESQMLLVYYGGAQKKENDIFVYDYKITFLDAAQRQEDNRQTLEDAVKEIQKEHDKIKYNTTDPLDYMGNLIHIGDTVGKGTFSGTVKKISGTQILVYWNKASFLVDKGKENDTVLLFGINWLENQWVEAKTVTLESGN